MLKHISRIYVKDGLPRVERRAKETWHGPRRARAAEAHLPAQSAHAQASTRINDVPPSLQGAS